MDEDRLMDDYGIVVDQDHGMHRRMHYSVYHRRLNNEPCLISIYWIRVGKEKKKEKNAVPENNKKRN